MGKKLIDDKALKLIDFLEDNEISIGANARRDGTVFVHIYDSMNGTHTDLEFEEEILASSLISEKSV